MRYGFGLLTAVGAIVWGVLDGAGGVSLLSLPYAQGADAPRSEGRGRVQWIWFNEGDPAKSATGETRYFRKVFNTPRSGDRLVLEATLDVTADDEFTVWINGVEIGKGNNWKRVYAFDVKALLVSGPNTVAVEAKNKEGSAGLMLRLAYVPNGQSRFAMVSDGSWKAAKTAEKGWQSAHFDDSKWESAKVLGNYGEVGDWKGIVWDSGGDDRFSVPPGFVVERVAQNPKPNDPFSLINLTFDDKGRLLVSQEGGPILLCTQAKELAGKMPAPPMEVKPYCEQIRSCQGMCWVKDALLLVGDGPRGTGLYRVRDTDGDDKTDKVEILHKFPRVKVPNYSTVGGMGEHGPHAIIHGPDNMLYLVVGNHCYAKPEKLAANSPLTRWPDGQMGPDQTQSNTTEDVLLPRLNDGRGHATNILAPGGTIWRMDLDGKNMSLVAAGFRNHYDAAFSPSGELFTYDSDMEWDVGLPWYRAVRVCHCPPGADYVWRTGAANTPGYYIDSLPPMVETGRGSPVGVEFYDHHIFPKEYQGAFFCADWAIGVIFAVLPEANGATYKGKAQRFCVGAPMNVTDLATGPDGAMYFTMGGRGTQGGVYRIAYKGEPTKLDRERMRTQPWSAFARAQTDKSLDMAAVTRIATGEKKSSTDTHVDALITLQNQGKPVDAKRLMEFAKADEAYLRDTAVWLIGVNGYKEAKETLLDALGDNSPHVRRRACEALIRAKIEPPIEDIWPLLGHRDPFLRTAARLVIQRIDPKKWVARIWQEKNHHIALEGIIALAKIHQAAPYAEKIFEVLHNHSPRDDVQEVLDHLRTIQMALIHTKDRPGTVRGIALDCYEMFPHSDGRVNRELAILLGYFGSQKILTEPVHTKLLNALTAAKDDRMQQVHYFYCLRLLADGWNADQKQTLLTWYDSTKNWEGGHSFAPFLENMLRELDRIFTPEDRNQVIAKAEQYPWAAAALLRSAPNDQMPSPTKLAELYDRLVKLGNKVEKSGDLKETILLTLSRSTSAEAQAAIRAIADRDPTQRDAMVRSLSRFPSAENWPYLVRGLESPFAPVILQVVQTLKKIPIKPKVDDKGNPTDAASYRALIESAGRLQPRDKWKVCELLRQWGGRKFTVEEGDFREELAGWSRWFAQTFPNEPPLPNVALATSQSKWNFDDLKKYLEDDAKGKNGDAVKGRVVFEKANCLKCHKFGKDGEGIGPDLTTLKSRFKRVDTLESIHYPSKIISDQYRGTTYSTKDGETVSGLAAVQGNMITILQLDGTKKQIKTTDVDQQVASTVSVMPEKLLDELTLQEIADLFAFLDSEPVK